MNQPNLQTPNVINKYTLDEEFDTLFRGDLDSVIKREREAFSYSLCLSLPRSFMADSLVPSFTFQPIPFLFKTSWGRSLGFDLLCCSC
jgi:hypothetical protein